MNDYLNVIRNNYANFEGRARRREYWMFTLINGLVILALEVVALVGGLLNGSDGTSISPVVWIAVALMGLYGLAVLVPSLAVSVRRLHDAGFSGWMLLLSLVPGVSIVVLVLHILDSKPGASKWGPNPKGMGAPVNAF